MSVHKMKNAINGASNNQVAVFSPAPDSFDFEVGIVFVFTLFPPLVT